MTAIMINFLMLFWLLWGDHIRAEAKSEKTDSELTETHSKFALSVKLIFVGTIFILN